MAKFIRGLLTTLLLLAVSGFLSYIQPTKASALSGNQWQPGYIMDDSLFFNPGAMSAQDIQTFLSAKVPNCDTNGTVGPYNGYPTRAQWAAANGKPAPPYTCLKDYTQTINNAVAPDAYCSGGVGAGLKSAAMIIAEVAAACGINPQVLVVLLQKEQSLVTDTWPFPRQYQFATGFCVYDSGSPPPSCEGTDGFFNQVYYAARQFQKYVKLPQNYNYRAGQTSNILWNVANTNCGGANVYVQNGATAALYNYTPYQPNAAALNNLYGSGDACSAYGNRNFWRTFNDWFGPTAGSLVKTANSNTVYLLNDTVAHPIYDVAILNDYAALGPVRVTSSSEINTHTGGPPLGRMVGDENGTLYLVNSGIKLPFTDCQSVADYGHSCGQVTYLDTLLLNKLVNGPVVTPLLKSNASPSIYYVTGGVRRPITSFSDMLAFKLPLNSLSDPMVSQLPLGLPVYGPGTLVKTANSSTVYLVKDAFNLWPIGSFIYPQEYGLGLGVRTIASAYNVLTGVENKLQCPGVKYLGTNGAAYVVPSAMMSEYGFSSNQFVDGGTVCGNVTVSATQLDHFIRVNGGTIFYVTGGQKQPIASYAVFQAHGGSASNTVLVSDFFANSLPTGSTLTN